MSNLLHANFCRLIENKLFKIAMGFMFFSGEFLVFQQYRQLIEYGAFVKLESTFFAYALMIGVVSAIFCSLFLGAEYNNGTMRNKIIAGHKRIDIYFANLIITVLASLLLCLSYILSNIILGIPFLGAMKISLTNVLTIIAGSIITVIALCSIFTMISLLIQNKVTSQVICIVGIFLLIVFTNEAERILDQPKYWYDETINTAYVDGAERKCLEFIYNVLPAGQEMQYARRNTDNINEMCLYSIGITIITTSIGVFFFRRKDIK